MAAQLGDVDQTMEGDAFGKGGEILLARLSGRSSRAASFFDEA
jgi:hypothetical protein